MSYLSIKKSLGKTLENKFNQVYFNSLKCLIKTTMCILAMRSLINIFTLNKGYQRKNKQGALKYLYNRIAKFK